MQPGILSDITESLLSEAHAKPCVYFKKHLVQKVRKSSSQALCHGDIEKNGLRVSQRDASVSARNEGGDILQKKTNLQDRTARHLENCSTFFQSRACPLLAGGVLPPFLEVSCGIETLDCGVGSEAAGRRQMNRNTYIRPGEHKRPSF